ncbi:histidine ammonia-lyase [Ferrimonas sediminum]|uniref:tyrosine ammonia-lyase n=1 Tax=Ferrimonas sediminum TaxID=718193 RepID=A0A1G8N962_9GAMM|nr:aromatic amino acid ammonia-lyase [Ferrimonas sediminum]SDI76732.1 histidine ammonia-lyase [Ferrimonas sediminum]
MESQLSQLSQSALIEFGPAPLTIKQVNAIAAGARVSLSDCPEVRQRLQRSADLLDTLLQQDGEIYGVTTGYGDSCTVTIPDELVQELPLHLTRFHGCGMGRHFDETQGRAILAARLASLCIGRSGVSIALLERMVEMLNHGVIPRIPEEGSVGASGDLTPLSYIAAALVGEREVYYQGQIRETQDVYAELGWQPLVLRPKEGLALMNGTAVMTAVACEAYSRADYLARLCARLTALCSLALKGNPYHFDPVLFEAKPHPGQAQIADWIYQDLGGNDGNPNPPRLQDRYSLRCAPHVIGVLADALPFLRQTIETELNSANDNPIIDGDAGRILHGGHFYGGHIAFAMDSLKNAVANLADLMDRQLAHLVDTKFNNGLPRNLSASTGERAPINHGFKAVQIGASAWTAEALKQTMPASVFSRSTECHNQDKVSMGTISARDALRVLTLTEQVASALLLASYQALTLRQRQEGGLALTAGIAGLTDQVASEFDLVIEDRPLEQSLRHTLMGIQQGRWEVPQWQ